MLTRSHVHRSTHRNPHTHPSAHCCAQAPAAPRVAGLAHDQGPATTRPETGAARAAAAGLHTPLLEAHSRPAPAPPRDPRGGALGVVGARPARHRRCLRSSRTRADELAGPPARGAAPGPSVAARVSRLGRPPLLRRARRRDPARLQGRIRMTRARTVSRTDHPAHGAPLHSRTTRRLQSAPRLRMRTLVRGAWPPLDGRLRWPPRPRTALRSRMVPG